MSDLASLKAQALQNLEAAWVESCRAGTQARCGLWPEQRTRRGRVGKMPQGGTAILWRDPVSDESTELSWTQGQADLATVTTAIYARLIQLRSRQNVLEFPAQLQESA